MSAGLKAEVRAALAALGKTPDAIAAKLAAEECSGVRMNSRTCPVAHYLARHVEATEIHVDHCEVRVYADEDEPWVVAAPDAVNEFAEAFDDGLYPQLENREP